MVFWNPHSFLFEVFWCVMLYFTVTALEVAPIALEDSRFGKIYRLIRKIAAPVVRSFCSHFVRPVCQSTPNHHFDFR